MLQQPNYTQVPNDFLDTYMAKLHPSATAVFLAICRKTIGWHKETDSISISQICTMTALFHDTVRRAVKELMDNDLVTVDRVDGGSSCFTINMHPLGKTIGDPSVETIGDPLGKTIPTKETLQKIEKETLRSPPAPADIPGLVRASELPRPDPKPIKVPGPVRKTLKHENKVKAITDYYQELFVEEYGGAKPTWDGRVMKLVRADVLRLGDALLGELIQSFFERPPGFVEKNETGKGYNVFHSMIDSLLERRARAGRRTG